MDGKRLSEIGMRIYFSGGESLLRVWYADLNKDDIRHFDEYVEEIVGSLEAYYDPEHPDVKIMSQQMVVFWESIQKMFPEECSLSFHRYLANRLYIGVCPDCGLHLMGSKRRRDARFLR